MFVSDPLMGFPHPHRPSLTLWRPAWPHAVRGFTFLPLKRSRQLGLCLGLTLTVVRRHWKPTEVSNERGNEWNCVQGDCRRPQKWSHWWLLLSSVSVFSPQSCDAVCEEPSCFFGGQEGIKKKGFPFCLLVRPLMLLHNQVISFFF